MNRLIWFLFWGLFSYLSEFCCYWLLSHSVFDREQINCKALFGSCYRTPHQVSSVWDTSTSWHQKYLRNNLNQEFQEVLSKNVAITSEKISCYGDLFGLCCLQVLSSQSQEEHIVRKSQGHTSYIKASPCCWNCSWDIWGMVRVSVYALDLIAVFPIFPMGLVTTILTIGTKDWMKSPGLLHLVLCNWKQTCNIY